MGFPSMKLERGNLRDGCQSGARDLLAQEQGAGQRSSAPAKKKPRTMPGLFA
jgi:hypothetical protein